MGGLTVRSRARTEETECPSRNRPLDICVICERPINRGEVILKAKVVGGIMLMDLGGADDEIIAVLENDNIWGRAEEVGDIPHVLIERLSHYFGSYKLVPGQEARTWVEEVYGKEHALRVVEAALRDYDDEFGGE